MSGCCASAAKKEKRNCPECGVACLSVSAQTRLHQLAFPNNQQEDAAETFFCAAANCAVGYFSAEGVVPQSELRGFRVDTERLLCHCFDISVAQYQQALEQGEAAMLKAFVVQQTKMAHCACEVRNPSGRCCLADFKRLENAFKAS